MSVIITTIIIIAAVTTQEGERGDEAGNVVHGCGKGDIGEVLVPWPEPHLSPKSGGR